MAIREQPAPTWHADVHFYWIESLQGELVGEFYLDLYAREHKQGGAWQSDARSRRGRRAGLATPVSYLTCNFSRPVGDRPATFRHDEVQKGVRAVLAMLLKELGHGVELAQDGQKGIELLKEFNDFDLVITDINMPNKNGNEVAKHIRGSYRSSIPVIAITAFPEEAETKLFDYIIEKPFMLENMRESVFRLTNGSFPKRVSFAKSR